MATAAFRSTTKRSSIGDAEDTRESSSSRSTGGRRRARSVSRFSHRIPSESKEFVRPAATPLPSSRKKFVNTVRGAAFPEISLDDLAIELFSSGERGRCSEVSSFGEVATQRRGRSVSRQGSSRVSGERKSVVSGRSAGGRSIGAGGDRRRRSISMVRYRASDSESDHSEKYSHGDANIYTSRIKQNATWQKQVAPTQHSVLQRCSSQRDFVRLHDGSSSQSHSSALTDDESGDAHYGSDGFENMQSVYARKKLSQFEAAERKHSYAIEEVRKGLKQVRRGENLSGLLNGGGLQPKDSDVLQAVCTVRSYSTELEQHKQALLAEVVLEKQCGEELERTVGDFHPDGEEAYTYRRPSRLRKRGNDRQGISGQLNQDADKIIEDFISSVEDITDISSFDGEKSDTSSIFGVAMRPRHGLIHFGEGESHRAPPKSDCLPIEMDGVVLPWLLWETSNDKSLLCQEKKLSAAVPNVISQDAIEVTNTAVEQEQSTRSNSSRGSWGPALAQSSSVDFEEASRTTRTFEIRKSQLLARVPRRSKVDVDDYLAGRSNEELIFERWKAQSKIFTGGIVLCEGSSGPFLL